MFDNAEQNWYTTLVGERTAMHLTFSALYVFAGLISILFTLFMVATVGIVAAGHIRKTILESADKALNLSTASAKELREQFDRLKLSSAEELKLVRDGFALQEKRIYRMEVEAARKRRQLTSAQTEIAYLESVVRVFLDDLTRLSQDKKRKVEDVLHELAQFRLRSAQDISDKDEIEETLELYMDRLSASSALTQSPLATAAMTAAALADTQAESSDNELPTTAN